MENNKDNPSKKSPFGPDEETLHSTDPQEHMHGPFSDRIKRVSEAAKNPRNSEPRYPDERYRDGADPWNDAPQH